VVADSVATTSPTAVTLLVETSSPAATPADLVSEETSTLPLVAITTVLPTLAAIPTVLPTPTEIPMVLPTLAETTSLRQTTTTVPATLAALVTDQTRPRSSDTTRNLLVILLAMTT
jgi:hypothetical protein